MFKKKVPLIVVYTLLVLVSLILVSAPPRHVLSVLSGLGFMILGIFGVLWTVFRKPPEGQK